jgi:hypothetical protein
MKSKGTCQGGNTHEYHHPNRINDSAPNPKQPRQTARELIAVNMKSLTEQLEAGHSDALTAYLNAMSRFPSLQFWQRAGDRTAEARCNARGWYVCVEPAGP